MAFSTNLRGLRATAMAVLVSGSFGFTQETTAADAPATPEKNGRKRTAAASNNAANSFGTTAASRA